jgi:hypothetical protein
MSFDPARLIAEFLVDSLLRHRVRVSIASLGVELTLSGPLARESIDERLAKIEVARESLTDALQAIDALKQESEENKRDLEKLAGAIRKAEMEKANLHSQLDALKDIAALDSSVVRQALKLPTEIDIWRDRIIAFAFGIAASTVAAVVWEYGIRKLL